MSLTDICLKEFVQPIPACAGTASLKAILETMSRSGGDRWRPGGAGAHRDRSGAALHRDQEGVRRQRLGHRSRNAILVLAPLCIFLRAGLLFRVVQSAVGVSGRDRAVERHSAMDGMSHRRADDRDAADAMFRLERGEFRE